MYFKTIDHVREYIEKSDIKIDQQLMILVAEKSADDLQTLMGYLNRKNIRFFGGIYAALLVKQTSESKGFIIQKHTPIYSAVVLPYLMRFTLDKEELQGSTAIVLVDGLSAKMKELTDTVYNKIGKHVNYIGGGAGFYDLKHRPCIFDNNGIYSDVLYICIVKERVALAVEHGWNKFRGPFNVTKSHGNILSELDGENAFEVYKDMIEDVLGIRLSPEGFFIYAKDHPFGILQENQLDVLVRDPIFINEDNEIVCVAGIPQDSKLYVLQGNTTTLLDSSIHISNRCLKNAPAQYIPLLFDCISRAMFLEDKFDKELSNIQQRLKYMVEGALSIGEIASGDNGELLIHNKSTILGLLQVKD